MESIFKSWLQLQFVYWSEMFEVEGKRKQEQSNIYFCVCLSKFVYVCICMEWWGKELCRATVKLKVEKNLMGFEGFLQSN